MPDNIDRASDVEFAQAIADASLQGSKDGHPYLKAVVAGYLVGKAVKGAKRKHK